MNDYRKTNERGSIIFIFQVRKLILIEMSNLTQLVRQWNWDLSPSVFDSTVHASTLGRGEGRRHRRKVTRASLLLLQWVVCLRMCVQSRGLILALLVSAGHCPLLGADFHCHFFLQAVELLLFIYLLFAVLEFELRAYTLSQSTSPFFVMGFFEIGSCGPICPGWL
jgi:hypothetical protein